MAEGIVAGGEVFDLDGVMRRLDRDDALFRELVEVFREEQPKLDGVLSHAVFKQDCDAVMLHAHSLKGALGNVGAVRASGVARALEAAGRGADTVRFTVLLAELQAEIRVYLAELSQRGY